jgi:tetratricopeptide (TPR) repeat protein
MNIVALAQGYVLKTKLNQADDIESVCNMVFSQGVVKTHSQAIGKFEQALDSLPNNKQVLMHLADLYISKKDIKKANSLYLQSLEIDQHVNKCDFLLFNCSGLCSVA